MVLVHGLAILMQLLVVGAAVRAQSVDDLDPSLGQAAQGYYDALRGVTSFKTAGDLSGVNVMTAKGD